MADWVYGIQYLLYNKNITWRITYVFFCFINVQITAKLHDEEFSVILSVQIAKIAVLLIQKKSEKIKSEKIKSA